MKTLHYRRHSIKDGAVKDTIGLKGYELAFQEGERSQADQSFVSFSVAFHGPLVRTAETLMEFLRGSEDTPRHAPAIEEIGNQKWFDELVTNGEYMSAVNAGKTSLEALYAAAGDNQALRNAWVETAKRAVEKMFEQMSDSETAIAFGHTPIIELAAENTVTFGTPLPEGWNHLAEMDGLVFVQNRIPMVSGIEVTEVIRAQRQLAHA